MASSRTTACLLLLAAALVCSSVGAAETMPPTAKGLSLGYYDKRCPQAESIVFNFLQEAIAKDVGLAAALLRLHVHDCFVHGCDASILLDVDGATPADEKSKEEEPHRHSLTPRPSAFKAIDDLRDLLDAACGGTIVSCSDIVTLAARDSVRLAGGPSYPVPLGRRDGLNSASEKAVLDALPPPSSNITELLSFLGKLNLDENDLVVLSNVGIAHCPLFGNRLYPKQDEPTMNKWFGGQLKLVRLKNDADNSAAPEQDLYSDARTKPLVTKFAGDQSAFFEQFVISMWKMGAEN
uniref:Peroxidase n=1 Tax=Oryza brachyantha TaxID=4533 RepID=J3L850_ORYBR